MGRWWKALGLLTAALVGVVAVPSSVSAEVESLCPPDCAFSNAFNACVADEDVKPLSVSLGYSAIWFRPARFPPLATTFTGNLATATFPGALTEPGTVVISDESRRP